MTWKLIGNRNAWLIQDDRNRHIATLTYCDPATARLFVAAQEMREALGALAEAVSDFHLTGPDGRSVKEWEASGARMLAAYQRALRLAAGETGEAR